MDKPLLALAVVTIIVYLFDLLRGLGDWRTTWLGLSLLIDCIFMFDLLLKLRVYGMAYVQTPWFLIDLISCLPLIDAIATGVKPIRAVRFVRAFRILRILRGLRILRALRSIPAFDQFVQDASASHKDKVVHHSMNIGLIGMTVTVLLFIVLSRKQMENEFIRRIDAEVQGDVSVGHPESCSAEPSIRQTATIPT